MKSKNPNSTFNHKKRLKQATRNACIIWFSPKRDMIWFDPKPKANAKYSLMFKANECLSQCHT